MKQNVRQKTSETDKRNLHNRTYTKLDKQYMWRAEIARPDIAGHDKVRARLSRRGPLSSSPGQLIIANL